MLRKSMTAADNVLWRLSGQSASYLPFASWGSHGSKLHPELARQNAANSSPSPSLQSIFLSPSPTHLPSYLQLALHPSRVLLGFGPPPNRLPRSAPPRKPHRSAEHEVRSRFSSTPSPRMGGRVYELPVPEEALQEFG